MRRKKKVKKKEDPANIYKKTGVQFLLFIDAG